MLGIVESLHPIFNHNDVETRLFENERYETTNRSRIIYCENTLHPNFLLIEMAPMGPIRHNA